MNKQDLVGHLIRFGSSGDPGRFLRHRGWEVWLQDDSIADRTFAMDSIFKVVDGLAGDGVSFESVNFPGKYIRHSGFKWYVHEFEDSDLYKKDASYTIESPLEPGTDRCSFRSVNYPKRLLHTSSELRAGIDEQNGTSFATNASWTIHKLSIPDLTGGTGVHLTMGPTDNNLYIKPVGTKTAVMVFIDFKDTVKYRTDNSLAAPNVASAQATSTNLLGASSQALKVFEIQSHGTFDLQVTNKSDLGWKVLDANSSSYLNKTAELLRDIKELFKDQVDFEQYDMTFVVQPEEAAVLNPNTPFGYSPSYVGLDAVVFGADSYKNRYVNLVHEVGHQIGLPDLYPGQGQELELPDDFESAGVDHAVGCMSIMADMQHSESFLGWERHKMGWLDDDRKLYLKDLSDTPLRIKLNPLTDSSGLSMIVVPLDDLDSPSRVFVVEIAQEVYGTKTDDSGKLVRDGTSGKEGVILYTVDATIASGKFPVKVIPKKASDSTLYGNLYEAPFAVDDSKKYTDSTANVEIDVTIQGAEGTTYTVDIARKATAV